RRTCRPGSPSAPSICAQCIKIPLPADLPAHCEQVATFQEPGVFSECGIHSSLLGGKAPQFEHLLQHRVIELNVSLHTLDCTQLLEYGVHRMFMVMYIIA